MLIHDRTEPTKMCAKTATYSVTQYDAKRKTKLGTKNEQVAIVFKCLNDTRSLVNKHTSN